MVSRPLVRSSVCLFVLFFTTSAWSDEKPTGADFLRIDPSARAASLGGGYGALVEDVHGLYYNPAGLALVGRTQMTATHTEWLTGMQNEFAGFAFPLGPLAWGFSVGYLHSEETERDDKGQPLSNFRVGDAAVTLGVGFRLSDRHHLGLNAKYLSRTLYHRSASGYAADLGYQYRRRTEGGSVWRFGVAVKNLGPDMGFGVKEKLPTEMEVALAWQPSIGLRRPLTLNAAVRESNFQESFTASTGIEYTLFSRFHLRGGYLLDDSDQKLRVGFGVDLFGLGEIDFAAVRIGQLNSSLFLSLNLQLSRE